MVRKDECSVRTIVVVVVHLPMLRRVLVEISMVRKDLCHFRDPSLAEHCFTTRLLAAMRRAFSY